VIPDGSVRESPASRSPAHYNANMAARLAVLACLLACTACKSKWSAQTLQPPLVLDADKEHRTSLPLAILMRDMDFNNVCVYEPATHRCSPVRMRLSNSAYYVAVSRDRFRFHITLHHKWDDLADINNWMAYVEDANGVRHYPEHVTRRVRPVDMSGLERRNSMQSHRPIYRGVANLTIYHRDLFAAGGKVTLVLWRPGYEYRYTWVSRAGAPES
jgi:hypothetical protein